jgi:SNF2 family DNA or RNA helicase
MKHQVEAIHKATYCKDLFLAWDMGTGKTCAIIQMIRDRCREEGRLRRVLILAPLVVLHNWKNEFAKFSNISPDMVHVLEGPVKKRVAQVEKQKGFSAIFITNYDAMQDPGMLRALQEWDVEILVCDESHCLKNYKSKRAKNIALLADKCKHRYLLSGTPILNSMMDLFMQYRILDGYLGSKATFGTNFFVFRSRYFWDKNAAWSGRSNYFPKWEPRDDVQEILQKLIYAKTLRVMKSDCLDLPDLVTQEIEVGLNAEQERLYKQMQKEFVTFIETENSKGTPKAIVARLAITKVLRLQQIVSGFVKTDDGETIRIKDVPRLQSLSGLLESITPWHKVIVWASFKENYRMIADLCKGMEIEYREIHGEQNAKEKEEAANDFNKNPEVRVLIGNQSAGGVGINLVSASYAIYYSRNFKLGDDLQSEARNYRRGSEIHAKITRINLVTRDTIDELIDESLRGKLDLSERILDFTQTITKERK